MRAAAEISISNRAQPVSFPIRFIRCIRFDEVLVLQGPPLIGAIFAIGALGERNVLRLLVLALGSVCLIGHVFLLNDWSGIHGDLNDPRRASRSFVTNRVTRMQVGLLAAAMLGVGLGAFAFLGTVPLLLALAIAGLSALYSAPPILMKSVPVFGSLLHLVGGTLHFLLGYTTFAPIDRRGVAIGCFFGLVFAAGHLMHETRDYETDLLNEIRTNAVAFGKVSSFFAGWALFTVAYALLVVLAALELVPTLLMLTVALYPIHLRATAKALNAGLTFESLRQLQRCYRALYAIIGIAIVATMLLAGAVPHISAAAAKNLHDRGSGLASNKDR